MIKFQDLTGQKFGRWTVLKISHKDNKRQYYWTCKCDCGTIKIVNGTNLRLGKTLSCGCLARELNSKNHQLMKNKVRCCLYGKWSNMKKRCYNPKNYMYKRYGYRNIKVCDEWLDKENGFINFYNWAINNGYEDGLTIDRIDVNGNYKPDNCRWADNITQANNKSSNHYETYNGEIHTIAEWSRILNINYNNLKYKIKKGMNIEQILK